MFSTSKKCCSKLLQALIFCCPLLVACVHRQQLDPYQSLMNQGILALSTDNAFAGANVFLSEELEQSQYLYEFFKGRGAPVAIELNRSNNGAPRMILYYPAEKQSYVASLVRRPDFHEWIVRGPYAMLRKDFRELEGITATVKGLALFEIDRRPYRFKEPPAIAVAPTPKPTPKIKVPLPRKPAIEKPTASSSPAASAVPSSTPAVVASAAPKEFHKLNSDQRALLIAKGFADRADNGDIIHTVKRPEETLADIARWYTDLEANAQVIAEANGIAHVADVLPTGTKVKVPANLIKQDKAMPTTYASGKVQREVPQKLPKIDNAPSEGMHGDNKSGLEHAATKEAETKSPSSSVAEHKAAESSEQKQPESEASKGKPKEAGSEHEQNSHSAESSKSEGMNKSEQHTAEQHTPAEKAGHH